jgi:hypothetical protein
LHRGFPCSNGFPGRLSRRRRGACTRAGTPSGRRAPHSAAFRGGTHGASNILGLCSPHHRAVHRGELHASSFVPNALVFQHADGTPHGDPVSAPRAEVCKKVFDGPCWLGFKANEARRALDECTRDGHAALDAGSLLREALERLGSCGRSRDIRRSTRACVLQQPPAAARDGPRAGAGARVRAPSGHGLRSARTTRPRGCRAHSPGPTLSAVPLGA